MSQFNLLKFRRHDLFGALLQSVHILEIAGENQSKINYKVERQIYQINIRVYQFNLRICLTFNGRPGVCGR